MRASVIIIIIIVLIICMSQSSSKMIDMNYYVINMKDRPDKFASFNRRSNHKFTRLDGVNIKESKHLYFDAIQEGMH